MGLEKVDFLIDLSDARRNHSIKHLSDVMMKLSRAAQTWDKHVDIKCLIIKSVDVLLAGSVLLHNIKTLVDITPIDYMYIKLYPEYSLLTITLVPDDSTDVDIRIENIPINKMIELLA